MLEEDQESYEWYEEEKRNGNYNPIDQLEIKIKYHGEERHTEPTFNGEEDEGGEEHVNDDNQDHRRETEDVDDAEATKLLSRNQEETKAKESDNSENAHVGRDQNEILSGFQNYLKSSGCDDISYLDEDYVKAEFKDYLKEIDEEGKAIDRGMDKRRKGIDAIEQIDPEEYERKMKEERERKRKHKQKKRRKKRDAGKDITAEIAESGEVKHGQDMEDDNIDPNENKNVGEHSQKQKKHKRRHKKYVERDDEMDDYIDDYADNFDEETAEEVKDLDCIKGKSERNMVSVNVDNDTDDEKPVNDNIMEKENSNVSTNTDLDSRKGRTKKKQRKLKPKKTECVGKETKADRNNSKDRNVNMIDTSIDANEKLVAEKKTEKKKKTRKNKSKERNAGKKKASKKRPSMFGINVFDMENAETAHAKLGSEAVSDYEIEIEKLPSIRNQLAKILGPTLEKQIADNEKHDESEVDEIPGNESDDQLEDTNEIETKDEEDKGNENQYQRPLSARLDDVLGDNEAMRKKYRSMSLPLQSDVEKLIKNMKEMSVEELKKPIHIPVYLPAFPQRKIIMKKQFKSIPKENGTLSRQQSFTVSQISRGNSFISQSNSYYANNGAGALQTEGTITESIKILSVKSPHEEHSGYRRDSTKFSTRDKLGFDFSSRIRRVGSGSTVVSRTINVQDIPKSVTPPPKKKREIVKKEKKVAPKPRTPEPPPPPSPEGMSVPEQYLEKLNYSIEFIQGKQESIQEHMHALQSEKVELMAQIAKSMDRDIVRLDYKGKGKKKKKDGDDDDDEERSKKKKKKKSSEGEYDLLGSMVTALKNFRPTKASDITDEVIVSRMDEKMMKKAKKDPAVKTLSLGINRDIEKLKAYEQRISQIEDEKDLVGLYCMDYYFNEQNARAPPYEFRRQQSRLYQKLHPDPDIEMNLDEVEAALQQVNNKLLTQKEFQYIYFVLDLPKREKINFRMFSIVAALSEKVTQMDPVIRKLINKVDHNALDVKMEKSKELFRLLQDESQLPLGNCTADLLAVELTAGGLTPEHTSYVLSKFNREGRGFADFLDFVTYVRTPKSQGADAVSSLTHDVLVQSASIVLEGMVALTVKSLGAMHEVLALHTGQAYWSNSLPWSQGGMAALKAQAPKEGHAGWTKNV
ncbi:hypothetical protein MAR_030681 [Mya arenaria]|uniref:Uncharacterized protein n=1 Tax=Mya arenaria TaxID=6604 RepID=A0ABY7F1K5_MYAAR|nr:hypothetical protein MAR_030681 [Mya arenaria]